MTDVANFGGLLIVACLYAAALRKTKKTRARIFDIAAFIGGSVTLAIALAPTLHELSESRLWAHMVQHELLVVIVAPLLVRARLHLILPSLLSPRLRRVTVRWLWRLQMRTSVAWALHAVALWAWHIPALYQAAVQDPLLHAVQHASFLGSALFFWWSVFLRRSEYGAAALYTFTTSLHTGVLGALLFLAPNVWYPIYGSGRAALEDQQLAGLIMWIPGGAVLGIVALYLIWRWLEDNERGALPGEQVAVLHSRAVKMLAIVLTLFAAATLASCNDSTATAIALTGGNPEHGKDKIRDYGCWTCHTIPGIHGANAIVGPSLDQIASRAYIAGQPNSPRRLIEWIRHPENVRRPTPMPDMGVNEADARDIAAYLYTLR
jgi:putative membrane protein